MCSSTYTENTRHGGVCASVILYPSTVVCKKRPRNEQDVNPLGVPTVLGCIPWQSVVLYPSCPTTVRNIRHSGVYQGICLCYDEPDTGDIVGKQQHHWYLCSGFSQPLVAISYRSCTFVSISVAWGSERIQNTRHSGVWVTGQGTNCS